MNVLKQVIGIDVAMGELVCNFSLLTDELKIKLNSCEVFKNKPTGFVKLLKWAEKHKTAEGEILFVMEATGVYHEKLAHWLHGQSRKVAIVLPNKISNYSKTLDVKTVTDKTAAEAIARFGLERHLETWLPPKQLFREIKQLTREREQIVAERVVIKNQLHAEKVQAFPNKNSIKRLNSRLRLLNKQEAEIKTEIRQLINQDQKVKQDVANMTSIPGVGELTAAIVLAETNGFELIKNKRQLASYAGFDVKEKQSGISVKGKPKISKKGNRYLRKAVHLPALSAVKHCEQYKNTYARLVGRHGIKMKALVAVQRKILELMYILYKTETVFDPDYEEKRKAPQNIAGPFESSLS
ncbi:IS110 family transposase [Echinicola vietnamensis]|uniref:Transposase n=1 Tax=Echinicola vietnamensis (strain DSM 17526 / LMG 23754 / KMM 6221) TaxID=926556 RepID=L0FUE6_ECHVK|nr:IS110 family transposase [Echinicola vietnamensis]AGA76927.1 transposase [Echinicola vietnamensis DSM 17526]AGA77898.1 transposase [Echinicola vietnamensis DSM 17526]